MKESRVLALAGVFQALSLVRDLAHEGDCDDEALEASLASVFKLESDSAATCSAAIAVCGAACAYWSNRWKATTATCHCSTC